MAREGRSGRCRFFSRLSGAGDIQFSPRKPNYNHTCLPQRWYGPISACQSFVRGDLSHFSSQGRLLWLAKVVLADVAIFEIGLVIYLRR